MVLVTSYDTHNQDEPAGIEKIGVNQPAAAAAMQLNELRTSLAEVP